MVSRAALALLACLAAASAASAGETLFVTCGRILPGEGDAIDGGRIVIREGKISQAGPDVARPAFSRAIDASGMTVTPGFVLPMTRLPLPPPPPPPPGEGFRVEIKPDAKAADEVRLRADALAALREQGVTLAGVLPLGREPGIPGFASVVATAGGPRSKAVIAEEAAVVVVAATPEPWRRAVSQAFERADAARRVRELAERRGDDPGGDPPPLQRALTRRVPVLLVAPSPALLAASADALPMERLDASVLDGTDLWWEAARVKELGCRVLTYPNLTRQRGTRFPINRASEWTKAGVTIAFVLPEDSVLGAARLRDSVVEMVRAGLPRDVALRALTSQAAAALGLGSTAGSIQGGRRADLLFWSGDPFEPSSRLLRVMSAGEFVARAPDAGGGS